MMKMLPRSNATLLVRTDFSDHKAWEAIRATIGTPNDDGFMAYASVSLPPSSGRSRTTSRSPTWIFMSSPTPSMKKASSEVSEGTFPRCSGLVQATSQSSAAPVYRALLDPDVIAKWRVPAGMHSDVHELPCPRRRLVPDLVQDAVSRCYRGRYSRAVNRSSQSG
nr:hypothetical protein [Actinomadura alba]